MKHFPITSLTVNGQKIDMEEFSKPEKITEAKDIKGYEGIYAITRDGRVWSYPNNRKFVKRTHGIWLKSYSNGYGYRFVYLHKNGRGVSRYIHRIVAETFIPNLENFSQVNHLNGIKTDNRVENLEWCNAKKNMKHALRTGLMKNILGENHYHAKLSEKDVLRIRHLYKIGKYYQNEIARMFKVHPMAVNHIIHNRSWKHI